MANRDPLHQSAAKTSGMDTGIKRYELPLLPFEWQLIDLAGITEEEYRAFAAEVSNKVGIRPAEYDLVPNIVAWDPVSTSIIVSLLIGAATTAASYFLMPKPRMPAMATREQGGGQRQLGGRTGATAFAPTSGFDSIAELAAYGDPVPIIFGRYTGTTGGMLISPQLVWSRSFSYGNQQAIKQLYIVSEQGVGTTGVDRPDLEGIFLGNTPLDAAYEHTFAFYWRSGTFNGTSRIKADNLRYGTRGTAGTGDPETNGDIFLAPTRDSQADTAFCSSFTPSSNLEFGAYAAIYNGTDYRVNWKIIAFDADTDYGMQATLERIKIAGSYGLEDVAQIRSKYQSGTGRAYSRRMGITSINGQTVASGTTTASVSKGQYCVFTIDGGSINENFYWVGDTKNVTVEDINNELDSQRTAADAALQLGEKIGRAHV